MGNSDGDRVGSKVGTVGDALGLSLGLLEGPALGLSLGLAEGMFDGLDGDGVGLAVICRKHRSMRTECDPGGAGVGIHEGDALGALVKSS